MEIKIWLTFVVTEFVLAITPGPSIVFVSSKGLQYGAKSSFYGATGISTANFIYFLLSAFGLITLILATENLFDYIKIGGSCYLIISGCLMIYKSFYKKKGLNINFKTQPSYVKTYIQGFITQISNPKAIVFFMAILPQFITTTEKITQQFIILAITAITVDTFVLLVYGWVSSKGNEKLMSNKKFHKIQDRIAGTVLISLGINLWRMKLR